MNVTFPPQETVFEGYVVDKDSYHNPNEDTYLKLLEQVLTKGHFSQDRTGTGTLSLFGTQARYDVDGGILPLLTTKKVSFNNILTELLWFLNGDTNTAYLERRGNTIWREWQDEAGNLGPIYGHQWRNFNSQGVDQIQELITGLRENPLSRRHIVSAWNPAQLKDMALPPCHSFFQLLAKEHEGEGTSSNNKHYHVSLMLHQRSADMFLGVPYNISSYTLLLNLICSAAQVASTQATKGIYFYPDQLIHNMGDCHVYVNHIDQVKEQLSRKPYNSPHLTLSSYDIEDHRDLKNLPTSVFSLNGYSHHPAIKAPVAI